MHAACATSHVHACNAPAETRAVWVVQVAGLNLLLTYLLTYLLAYLLTCLLTFLLTYLLTYLRTYLLTYVLTYVRTYSLTVCWAHGRRARHVPSQRARRRLAPDHPVPCALCPGPWTLDPGTCPPETRTRSPCALCPVSYSVRPVPCTLYPGTCLSETHTTAPSVVHGCILPDFACSPTAVNI